MSERLRPRDLAFLATESRTTPMHNATVEIFDPGESGFDYARLVDLIADRHRVRPALPPAAPVVPGRLATPVWVDDPDFDLGYHVRRSALPRPATTTSSASSSRGSRRDPSTGRDRCGRPTSSRGSATAASRS